MMRTEDFVWPAGEHFKMFSDGGYLIVAQRSVDEPKFRQVFLYVTRDWDLMVVERSWRRVRQGFRRVIVDDVTDVLYCGKSVSQARRTINAQLLDVKNWMAPLGEVTDPEGWSGAARGAHSRWTDQEIADWVGRVRAKLEHNQQLERDLGLTVDGQQMTDTQRLAVQVAQLADRYSRSADAEVADFERELGSLLSLSTSADLQLAFAAPQPQSSEVQG